jgi:hypothetical protein
MTEPDEVQGDEDQRDPAPTLGGEHRIAAIRLIEGVSAPAESDAEPPAEGSYGQVAQGTYRDLMEGKGD